MMIVEWQGVQMSTVLGSKISLATVMWISIVVVAITLPG